MLAVWVKFLFPSQVSKQALSLDTRMLKKHYSMSVLGFYNLDYLASLARVKTLQNTDLFSDLKELLEMVCLNFYCDGNVLLGLNLDDLSIVVNSMNDTLAALELPRMHFAPIADLHLELTVVADRLENSLVGQDVPLVLIRVIRLQQLVRLRYVDLEFPNFFEHRTHLFSDKF